MDLCFPDDKDSIFLIEVKKVDCFKLIKKSIKCANDRVAATPGIFGSVNGDLNIVADCLTSNTPSISIPFDTLVNTSLNTEDD